MSKKYAVLPANTPDTFFPEKLSYEMYQKDKFIFRLPKDEGFYFNENDVWAYVYGKHARIGVTDYVQKSLSDILFFSPPPVGAAIDQFGELGAIESNKAIFEIVSPVSGVVTAINENLIHAPEMINQSPYEQGWIAEVELTDFIEDSDLLHTFNGYMPILKRKVDEYHVKS
ncbi:MAG: glycine cleavage system protein H [Treponema sp.]|nr:glycine cleavage system protein H [Treponema sp.]